MTLETLTHPIHEDLITTEAVMSEAMHSDVPLVCQVSEHIAGGGKRIRPMVVLLLANCFDYHHAHKFELAAVIEFIHTATLLHDDVIDDSQMRRGKTTANNLWGNEASVLTGDFLYSRAFQMLVKIQHMPLMQILAKASNVMAEGEVLQLMYRHNPEITENIYQEIIEAKTAKLFEAAAEMIATLSGATEKEISACRQFGRELGLAFQVVDDALDYQGDSEQLGKNLGDDLSEGKVTLPLLYLLHQGTDAQNTMIKTAIAKGGDEHMEDIFAALAESDAIEYTTQRALQHAENAKYALSQLPRSAHQEALMALTDFVVQRVY